MADPHLMNVLAAENALLKEFMATLAVSKQLDGQQSSAAASIRSYWESLFAKWVEVNTQVMNMNETDQNDHLEQERLRLEAMRNVVQNQQGDNSFWTQTLTNDLTATVDLQT